MTEQKETKIKNTQTPKRPELNNKTGRVKGRQQMKPTKAEQTEAREFLLKTLKPGDTIYTITRHVSRSGMMRRISAFIVKDNKIYDLDWQIARTGLFQRHHSEEGLIIGGCGMDMHFHVVYELGRVLFPDGFKLAKGQYGRNSETSGYDRDGGYAFKKSTL